MATQYRLDKERLDKNRLEEISIGEFREESPALTHNFGEFQNVFLSDEELSKLKSEFPDYEKRIERLSAYMNSTGRTYKNHYSTIKSWAMKEEQQSTPKQHAGSNVFLELLHDMEGQTE